MVILVAQISAQERSSFLDGDILTVLFLLGAIVLLVVGYLVFDWLKARREVRRLTRKRQMAREAWEQEQSKAKR